MAGELKATLRLTADGKGFIGEIRSADRSLDKLRGNTRRAASSTDRLSRSADRAGRSFKQAHGHWLKYAGYIGGVSALSSAIRGTSRLADEYTNLDNRLRLVTRSEAEQVAVRERLTSISHATRTELASNAALYARLALAAQESGRSQQDLLAVTELLNKQVAIGGNTSSEAAAGLTQFAQGLASGRLQGDELRSVLENLQGVSAGLLVGFRRLRQQGQISFDVTRGNIRDLAAEGKLSADLLLDAILASADDTNRKFTQVDITISGALTNIGTAALTAVGGLDQALGVSATLADSLNNIAQGRLDEGFGFLDEALVAGGIILTTRLIRSTRALAAAKGVLAAATAKANRFLAANAQVSRRGVSSARRLAAGYRALGAAASVAGTAARGLIAAVGGIPGILALSAYGVYELIQAWRGATGPGRDYLDLIAQIKKERAGQAAAPDDPLAAEKNALIEAQELARTAALELERLQTLAQRDVWAANPGELSPSLEPDPEEHKEDISAAEEAVLRTQQAVKDAEKNLEETSKRLIEKAATAAAMSPAAQALINQFLPQEAQIKAAAEQALGQLQAERDRLADAGGTASAIQSVDDAMARVEQDLADKLAAAAKQRLDDIIQLAQSLASEEDKLKALYEDQVALIERKAVAAGLDEEALLQQARAQHDARLATIKQREADEQARAAAEALRAEQASGRPALDRLIESNRELAEVTDYSAEAIARRTEAARIAADIEADYKDATDATKQALQEQLEVQAALLRQQQLRAELMDTYGGAAPQPERQEALDALLSQGQLAGLAAQAAQAEINIDAGEGGIADGYISELGRMVAETETAAAQMGESFARVFGPGGSFSVAIADSAARAIVFGGSFRDAIGNAAREAVAALISQLIQLGIQLLITKAIGATIATTANAAQVAQVTAQVTATSALAAQNAFAATAAIPIIGPGLAPAAATAAGAAAQAIGSAAIAATAVKTVAFARGGVVEEPTFFAARGIPAGVAGEAGPEAIMPLRRLPSGRLGVESTGRPGRAVTIAPTIHVNVQGSANDPDALGQVIGQRVVAQLQPLLRAAIADEQRPGGLLNKTSVV